MISGIIARMRSLWRGARRRSDVESEMNEEFRLHVEMRAQDLVRSGLSPADAVRQARREFGSPERYKGEARASRGLHYFDGLRFSWLDFKLGFRMLARYPGLTLVGGLAMAFAVWIGAGTFELIGQWLYPRVPLPEADRIVGIELRHTASREEESRVLRDFVTWREALESVEDLGAFHTVERNLFVNEGQAEPIEVVEISASAFRVARVTAQLGRVLIESDELEASPPVIVIGHELWQTRFDADPGVIGRTVRLGNVQSTVVGVMPESFAFPVSHEVWAPLRVNALDYAYLEGPELRVLGRLALGATLDDAQAELDYMGLRAAADFPDTHEHLRPRVMPYAQSLGILTEGELAALPWINLLVVMLVILVCGNVGLLMLARAATRESEIVVRNALGASRGRIVTQLLAEALVLGGVGAMVGLAATRPGLRWAMFLVEGNGVELPFWVDDRLSLTTMLYAVGLTVLGAVIAGVLPALRVTRGLGARLRQATAGGGGLKFGGVWTVVIVAQVAVTVAFPSTTFFLLRERARIRAFDVGFAEEQYLSVQLELDSLNASGMPADRSRAEFFARFRRVYQQLERRLSAESSVEGVTFADELPHMVHGARRIDLIEGIITPQDSLRDRRVNIAFVDGDYFDVLGAPLLSGRSFNAADLETGHHVIVVNQTFVDRLLQGRNPIGRRVRFTNSGDEPAPWYEIIGVARDLGMNYLGRTSGNGPAGLYHPLVPGEAQRFGVHMAMKTRGNPASFAPRLRAIAQAMDPTLRLQNLRPLDELDDGLFTVLAIFLRVTILTSSVALLLSLAGIYSVTSFAVSRRTREIGIRVALGADARRVMRAIFSRPVTQVGVGIVAGGGLVAAIARGFMGGLSTQEIALVIAYAALMMGVCMLACIVPARRALAVEPTEALNAEE